MNGETLERLLIDRSLGQLGPDTEALLDAYVRQDPAAGELDRQFRQAAEMARAAVSTPAPDGLPAFDAAKVRRRRPLARWGKIAAGVGTMAACVALGMLAHLAMAPKPLPLGVIVQTVQQSAPPRTETAQALAPDDNSFWSAKRLYRQVPKQPAQPPAIVWTSPLEPQLGGRT